MAQYNDLPVYKAAYDALLQIFALTHQLSKEYKYTLGEKLKNEITDLLTNIYRANRQRDKNEILLKSREQVEIIRLYIRILKDTKQISNRKYIYINTFIENVSKQLSGWQKYSN
jgi:proline dehydrogenase